MNKEYYISRGTKIVVNDENGITHIRENCDNIDEILRQENLIEELDNGRRDLIVKITWLKLDMISVKDVIKTMIALAVIMFPTGLIVLGILANLFLSTPLILSETIKILTIIIAALEGLLAVSYSIFQLPKYLKAKKELPIIEENLELLKEKLEKEKQKLFELKNTSTKNCENQNNDRNTPTPLETYDYKQLLEEAKKELSNETTFEKGRQLVKR